MIDQIGDIVQIIDNPGTGVLTDFRQYVPASDHPKIAGLAALDAHGYRARVLENPWIRQWTALWKDLYDRPFAGISTDGSPIRGLFPLADEQAPVAAMSTAAHRLLERASAAQRQQLCRPIDAAEWRIWSNPEFYIHAAGVRLEEQPELQEPIFELVRTSLSARGYSKIRAVMKMNAFLGDICNARGVMNEFSYNFTLFGRPDEQAPWGWQMFGHHLALNCFVLGRQMVLSPCFLGAEPNFIDTGPDEGLTLFRDEERLGLELMRSLPARLHEKALAYRLLHDPAMPPGRFHRADQRHLGGAFQDNRVVPYEGVNARHFARAERERLLEVAVSFLEIMPEGALAVKLRAIEDRLDETWFAWIGGIGDDDAFYYRIQSPVIMIEFDHHSGVFLTNTEPAKCHTHTIIRTPNGNDYGKDILRQHYEAVHPGRMPGAA
jgi:Protein of unknown function (DUF3500)